MRKYFMTSERLGFSVWNESDIDLALCLWGDPLVTRYISASGVFTQEQIEARLDLEISNGKKYGVQYWPVFLLESGDFAGVCGLRPHGPAENRELELGCHLRPYFWGRGIATEASRRAIGYAFEELGAESVFAGHNPSNKGSERVAKALRFKYIGSEFYEPTGLMHPSYRLSKEEYMRKEVQP